MPPHDEQLILDYPDAPARVTFSSLDTIAFGRQSMRRRGRMHQRGRSEDVVVTLLPVTLSDGQRELMHRQLVKLRGLKHPCILPFYGAAALGSHHLAVVSPLMCGGNLVEYAETTFPEDRLRLVTEMVEAIEYLHDRVDMVHGHLKPSKILVSGRGSVRLSVITAFYYDSGPHTALDLRPSAGLRYTAPELLLSREASQTTASDVYACGMLIYETMAGVHPLANYNDRQAIAALARGKIQLPLAGGMNREIWNLCRNCCSMSPSSRPTARAILRSLRRIGKPTVSYPDALAKGKYSPSIGRLEIPIRPVALQPDISGWKVTVSDEGASNGSGDGDRDSYTAKQDGDDESAGGESASTAETSPTSSMEGKGSEAESDSSDEEFYDCESWPSSPRTFTATGAPDGLVEMTLSCVRNSADGEITIVVPKQTPIQGGMAVVLKGYANVGGRVQCLAIKILKTYEPEFGKREERAWRKLNHPHVLPFYGACSIPVQNFGGPIQQAFVSPFMKQGTLANYLYHNPRCDRLKLMIEVAEGMCYLHHVQGIVHGDINQKNILISDDGRALLADFGLSTTVARGEKLTGENIRSSFTLEFCAPEILDDEATYPSEPDVKRSKTTMSDVYAYGMLVYTTYAGKPRRSQIFKIMGDMEQGRSPPRPARTTSMRNELWAICKDCWAKDPNSRPSMEAVLTSLRFIPPASPVWW